MDTILAYIAVHEGKPTRASLELLSRCREEAGRMGWRCEAFVVAEQPEQAAGQIRRYGPSKIWTSRDTGATTRLNGPLLKALSAAIGQVQPRILAFASTERAKDVMGALSAETGAPCLPDMSEFEVTDSGVRGKRPVMASRIVARVEAEGNPVILSVRAGSYELSEDPSESETEEITLPDEPDDSGISLREILTASGEQVDLAEAKVIVAAGRGIRDEKGVELISGLAGVLDAGIGASRALTESGVYDPSLQIGQTGKVVAPDLYIAVGISGAVQHVAGITGSRVILAINRDPDAPIFDIADYGIVGDLYEVLPRLIEEIGRIRGRKV